MTYALRDALVGLTPCASTIVGAATQHSVLALQAHAIGGDPPRDPIGSRSDLWSVGVVLASLCLAPLCSHGSRLVGRGPKLSGSALPKGAPFVFVRHSGDPSGYAQIQRVAVKEDHPVGGWE